MGHTDKHITTNNHRGIGARCLSVRLSVIDVSAIPARPIGSDRVRLGTENIIAQLGPKWKGNFCLESIRRYLLEIL